MDVQGKAKANSDFPKLWARKTFSGPVGAKSLPAIEKEVKKLEDGQKRGAALNTLARVKLGVSSLENKAMKYMEGSDNLVDIKSSMKPWSNLLFDVINAIGDETGGDKAASVKEHEKLAKKAKGKK